MNPKNRPDKPITPHETREWRETVLDYLDAIKNILAAIQAHQTKAVRFAVTITSEPLTTDPRQSLTFKGGIMPVAGTIAPNSRAVVAVVPQAADGTPTKLDGNLRAVFVEAAVFTIDSTDPLNIILKVEPPSDIDAQPQTHCTIDDDTDSDPTLEITFDWQKAVVIVKATQFGTTITSEPL